MGTTHRLAVALSFCAALALLASAQTAAAADLRIAVVNVNKAVNESEAGKRSKKVLQDSFSRRENDLKAKEASLRKMVEDVRTNMMLSEAAKADKEKEFRAKEGEFRQEVQSAQRDLQEQERKMTDTIVVEIKRIVGLIAAEKKYDLVVEQAAIQVLLYTTFKPEDITAEVIDRYNKDPGKTQ
jgi:outer membrane protein